MSLPLPPLPFLDKPALDPAGDDGGPVVPGKRPGAMVRFLDGTLRLCRVAGWRKDPGGWACLLRWSVAGRPASGWYLYDEERMKETG